MTNEKNLSSAVMLARLSNLLEKSDAYTKEHSSRVVTYSKVLAIKAGLSDDDIKKVEMASSLHDIGKMGIGNEILNKPSKLTVEEYEQMKKHPEIAVNILRELSFMMDVVDMVYSHHERIDGKGYPQGLKGDEIPIGSRIIAITDAYDAMISDRPYRKAMKEEDAILELQTHSGTQFDEDLVNLFIKELKKP